MTLSMSLPDITCTKTKFGGQKLSANAFPIQISDNFKIKNSFHNVLLVNLIAGKTFPGSSWCHVTRVWVQSGSGWPSDSEIYQFFQVEAF